MISRPSSTPKRSHSLVLLSAAVVCSAFAIPLAAQAPWQDVDGLDLLRTAELEAVAPQAIQPHRDILVAIDFPAVSTSLRFRGPTETRVAAAPTPERTFGFRTLRFSVPILEVGAYDLHLIAGDAEIPLGPVVVHAFRCYFNRPGDPRQTRNIADVVAPVHLQKVMARYIDRAKTTVDIAMSDFDHPDFVQATIRAHERGVRVRFITDERTLKGEAAARAKLTAAGVPWIANGRDLKISRTMHHKFIIVDGYATLAGHAKGDIFHSRINQSFVAVHGRPVAEIYRREFDEMWGSSGAESPLEKRRFAKDKTTPRFAECEVRGIGGPVRVEVVFAPDKDPVNKPQARPINVHLRKLVRAAQSDILYMASGFGDTFVGKDIQTAMRERGVRFVGTHGDPDWTDKNNALARAFRGEEKDAGWPSRPDVVGAPGMSRDGVFVNLHNRAIVFDVLGRDTQPTVCFSSGAWRMGVIRADDSMICIYDRRVAEQFLQHFGGTRRRAFAPLDDRGATIARGRLRDGNIDLPLTAFRRAGGIVEHHAEGGLIVSYGYRALRRGDVDTGDRFNDVDELSDGDVEIVGGGGWIRDVALARLGVAIVSSRVGDGDRGNLALVTFDGATVPVELPTEAAAKVVAPFDGEIRAGGLVMVPSGSLDGDVASSPGLLRIESRDGNPLADRFVFLRSWSPYTKDAGSGDPNQLVLVHPHFALSLHDALARWQQLSKIETPFTVVDGWGLRGPHVRAQARRRWRSRRGWGVVLRMDDAVRAKIGEAGVASLIVVFAGRGFDRIGIDRSMLGRHPMAVLDPKGAGDWKEERPGKLYRYRDRRTLLSLVEIGAGQIELELSLWHFSAR